MPTSIGRSDVDKGTLSKIARISDVSTLENGTYWSELNPHFRRPDYKHLCYRMLQDVPRKSEAESFSVRGASSIDVLDVAYVADKYRAALWVADDGVEGYCLTLIQSGKLDFSTPTMKEKRTFDQKTGLLYRGLPDTTLIGSGDHRRAAIWIPADAVKERLVAYTGEQDLSEIEFIPEIPWEMPSFQGLGSLFSLLLNDFGNPSKGRIPSSAAHSMADLLIYTILSSVPHNHTAMLEHPSSVVLPRTQKRAEEYIASHLDGALSLHDIAGAAGCSVRSLQLGFQRYRNMTPLRFILERRLDAAHRELSRTDTDCSVIDVAFLYGFSNPGRFAGQFKARFGKSPSDILKDSSR